MNVCVYMCSYVCTVHAYICMYMYIVYYVCICLCVLVHKFNIKMLVEYCCVFGTDRNKGFNT